MTDPNTPDLDSENAPDGAGRTATGTGRVRFPLARWVLAPRTTWQARRLAADFGKGMDAKTAWVMARLARNVLLGYHHDVHRMRRLVWWNASTGSVSTPTLMSISPGIAWWH
ncbi:hypothetical protein ABT030_50700 [Streptomyces mirabilis]|uniref:hypothetical protein n=1 Tax=Streptomyces mirabilis TaxID=68239 RepID=UPI003329C2E5